MKKMGQPKKPVDELRVTFSCKVDQKWLKAFRTWSKDQVDSQGRQVEAGINLLIEDRKENH